MREKKKNSRHNVEHIKLSYIKHNWNSLILGFHIPGTFVVLKLSYTYLYYLNKYNLLNYLLLFRK